MKQILYLLLNIPLFVTTTREDSRVGFIKFLRFIKFIKCIKRPSDKIKTAAQAAVGIAPRRGPRTFDLMNFMDFINF